MRRIFATIATAILILIAANAARAEPLLWKVEDADSTMYMFGTIHILDQGAPWRAAQFDAAFKEAEEVWFEIDPLKSADPAALAPYQSLMIDPLRPISKRLSPEEYALFSKVAGELGVPAAQLDNLRPWLAAVQLTLAGITRAGGDPNAGVDRVLAGEVGERPLKTLETLEQQLRFFADMPEDVERAFLLSSLDELDAGPGYFQRMAQAWRDGDIAALEELFLRDMREDYPQTYETLLKQRNLAWAEVLDAEMRKSGSDFVAVGALHLVGPDGVPALLEAKGYQVRQISAPPK